MASQATEIDQVILAAESESDGGAVGKNPTIRDPGRRRAVGRLREAEAVEPLDAGMMRTVARRTSGSSEVSHRWTVADGKMFI